MVEKGAVAPFFCFFSKVYIDDVDTFDDRDIE
jgi:hypothetical protein